MHRPVGQPTVVELGSSYADGGEEAERVLLERLLAALAPLRKEDAPPVQASGSSICRLPQTACPLTCARPHILQ